jgi:hypothetical protein
MITAGIAALAALLVQQPPALPDPTITYPAERQLEWALVRVARGDAILVDNWNVKVGNGRRSAWVKQGFRNGGPRRLSQTIWRMSFNCDAGTARPLYYRHYVGDRLVEESAVTASAADEPVQRRSLMHHAMRYVCDSRFANGSQPPPSATASPQPRAAPEEQVNHCLGIVTDGSGVHSFRNYCNFAVEFNYCAVEQNCLNNILHVRLSPGGIAGGGFRGRAFWLTCRQPARPTGVYYIQGRGLSGTCQR